MAVPSTAVAGETVRDGPSAIRLDIQQVTLDGYSPGRRGQFARTLQSRLAAQGVPHAVARRAAEAILGAVDARTGGAR